jgi:hypothetical protein
MHILTTQRYIPEDGNIYPQLLFWRPSFQTPAGTSHYYRQFSPISAVNWGMYSYIISVYSFSNDRTIIASSLIKQLITLSSIPPCSLWRRMEQLSIVYRGRCRWLMFMLPLRWQAQLGSSNIPHIRGAVGKQSIPILNGITSPWPNLMTGRVAIVLHIQRGLGSHFVLRPNSLFKALV